MKRIKWLLIIPLLVLLLAPAAYGQSGTSEVQGTVVDTKGNPIPDAIVTFENTTASDIRYTERSNKKGRYFIPGLLYYEPGEWNVTIQREGYAPRKIKVESRKSDRTLVGKYESGIKAGQPHVVRVKAFGKAKVDFVMITEQALREQRERKAAAAQAEAAAEAVAQADPFQLASMKVNEGDLEGSLPFFARALEAEPADAERRELYAKVLYNLERYDEARVAAEEAAALDPTRAGVHLVLADVHVQGQRYDEARAALARASELSPQETGIFKRAAWIAEETGDTQGVIRANERLVELDPDHVETWVVLGGLYADAGDLAKSEAAFQRVIEIDPENAYTTFFNIGAVIQRKSNPTAADDRRAVSAFKKAIEIKPDYAKAHRELGYALLRTGDLAGARSALEQYLELQPDAQDSASIRAMVSGLPR